MPWTLYTRNVPPRIPRLLALLGLAALSCRAPSAPNPRTIPREDDPDAAAHYAAMKRGLTSGINPHVLYHAAPERIAPMPHLSVNCQQLDEHIGNRLTTNAAGSIGGASLGTWTSLGPGNIGGRT